MNVYEKLTEVGRDPCLATGWEGKRRMHAKIGEYIFQVRQIRSWHDRTVEREYGIWRGTSIIHHLYIRDGEDYDVYLMKVGETMVVNLEDMSSSIWVMIRRLPDETEVPDNRGRVLRFIHWLFGVKYRQE